MKSLIYTIKFEDIGGHYGLRGIVSSVYCRDCEQRTRFRKPFVVIGNKKEVIQARMMERIEEWINKNK